MNLLSKRSLECGWLPLTLGLKSFSLSQRIQCTAMWRCAPMRVCWHTRFTRYSDDILTVVCYLVFFCDRHGCAGMPKTKEAMLSFQVVKLNCFWTVSAFPMTSFVGHHGFLWSYCSVDVTGGFAQLNLQGPRSRELLAKLTSAGETSDQHDQQHLQ